MVSDVGSSAVQCGKFDLWHFHRIISALSNIFSSSATLCSAGWLASGRSVWRLGELISERQEMTHVLSHYKSFERLEI